MIPSSGVARWTWSRWDRSADEITLCLRGLLSAHHVLTEHRFSVGGPAARLTVTENGNPTHRLFDRDITLRMADLSSDRLARVVEEIRSVAAPGEVGSADARMDCTAVLLTEEGEREQERAFLLSSASFAGFAGVDLETYTDVWMRYDVKGRPQPAVHSANAPRLTAVLSRLADALGTGTEPEDPTCFGTPTPTGVDNRYEADGSPSDVWGRFEIPSRKAVFEFLPPFHQGHFGRTADGTVQYVPVRGSDGLLLGHLWASDPDGAASFAPRDAAGEDGHRAGLVWLDRLRATRERGLSPSQALAELSSCPGDPVAGQADPRSRPRTMPLRDLRDRARDA
ncbi:hypothetical protein [Streptomyces sp. MJP52]|uniref:hypothetical protein n=1 Tax=Streptomyces sp. MJP52 TaxID=2940555 RepID=UPI002474187E|nr:hypothetical protein [Streptomyces sp. MJP52]MDH6227254.1 hypothetical protein [Streptomyces sp. MJP52]